MPTMRQTKYPKLLPPTPVSVDMRERMIEAVKASGESIAELQRRAFTLFLNQNFSNPKVEVSKNNEGGDVQPQAAPASE